MQSNTERIPCTIDELKGYCLGKGMDLEKMRFFIGEDYREARAFGIYRDGDRFVVYKNKSDGSRAVRYHGPDEAYAVKEIYLKLLDECHKRGVWPEGDQSINVSRTKLNGRLVTVMAAVIIAVAVLIITASFFMIRFVHKSDGYYRIDDGRLYYRYGNNWYMDDYYDWTRVPYFPYDDYDDYYEGSDFDHDWGSESFTESDTWERIREEERSSPNNSSDYSSWDSGDTDWDSDW